MYTPKFYYIGKDHEITVRDKGPEITVRELKIVRTHVYTKILLYWQRS